MAEPVDVDTSRRALLMAAASTVALGRGRQLPTGRVARPTATRGATAAVGVYAPAATRVELVRYDVTGGEPVERGRADLERLGDAWHGEVALGTHYGLVAHGHRPAFDPTKVLLDPRATAVWFPPGHDRRLAERRGRSNAGRGPLAVAVAPTPPRSARPTTRPLVVYEAHVDGFTRTRGGASAGTYGALAAELPRLAALGVSVLELLPVHQRDPQEGSYWGYMPLAFAAVEQRYAAGGDPAGELAELIAAAHDHDIEVWLDVVFNHTTEVGRRGPTYSLRGLADRDYYRRDAAGRYIASSGCGNDLEILTPAVQDLIRWALDRLADLGVDGFRFDLAPILSHDPAFISGLDEWAAARGVRLIAEPWDVAGRYQLGGAWPGVGWRQWNDRFRDDVRSFLRGDEGYVGALQQRIQGSPDLFTAPAHSVNFVTCHDGFTLHDLVSYDRKHNEANGERNRDGSDHNRSWNCGWEGEDGAPAAVLALRRRQLRNAWCLLLLSHGVPMWTAGDEFGRTQGGNNNAYNQDNPTSWVDWERAAAYADLERFVGCLLGLRHGQPVFSETDFWGDAVRWFGATGPPDLGVHSRSAAWQVGDLYVMANIWTEPISFDIQVPGPWCRVVDTNLASPDDIVEVAAGARGPAIDAHYVVAPHSIVVLHRR